MGLIKALVRDLTTRTGWYSWVELAVRGVPGEFGIALRRLVLRPWFKAAGPGLLIMPGTRIFGVGKLSVGENCRIGLGNMIQANGEIEMGSEVILGPNVKIWSVNHVFASLDEPIWNQGYDHRKVVIGNGVWIGADCFIMPGAHIGDHVVVSAGSGVGGKGVPPFTILAGNPARRIGTRAERTPASP